MSDDVKGTTQEQAIEAKVEESVSWSPNEWRTFVLRSAAMLRELATEAQIHEGRLSDLHDRIYPGADCNCERRCPRCKRADDIAQGDALVHLIGGLRGVWDDVAAAAEDAAAGGLELEPGEAAEFERRLRRVRVRSSAWVELAQRRRREGEPGR